MPIFVSMFVGLRGMANLPLESMMHGGLFWFEDLTIADPFYALPVMTSITMFLQFKFAAEGASMDTAGPIAKNVFRVLPFALLPMTINFPAVNFVLDCLCSMILFSCVRSSLLDKNVFHFVYLNLNTSERDICRKKYKITKICLIICFHL